MASGDGAGGTVMECADLISATLFGAIKGNVGEAHELFQAICHYRHNGRGSDGDRDMGTDAAERMLNCLVFNGRADFFRDERGAGMVRGGQDNRELLAAIPSGKIAGAQRDVRHGHGDGSQAFIATLMAEAVVELLEMIDVDNE